MLSTIMASTRTLRCLVSFIVTMCLCEYMTLMQPSLMLTCANKPRNVLKLVNNYLSALNQNQSKLANGGNVLVELRFHMRDSKQRSKL